MRSGRAGQCLAAARFWGLVTGVGLASAPALAQSVPAEPAWPAAGLALAAVLGVVLLVVAVWRMARVWRTRTRQSALSYTGIEQGPWPELTVFVAACHDAHAVSSCIQLLLNADYPAQRVRIVPVCDQVDERTQAVIDAYTHLFPERIQPHRRDNGLKARGDALQEAMALARGDIAIVVDATYVPSPGLLKQLALPFFDPEVGAVMGRVVQLQAASSLFSRVLGRVMGGDLLAGQPLPHEASMHLRAVPDGNAVGGVRLSAVVAVGGWSDGAPAPHTDITVRLLSNGWKTVYNHRAECVRAVPEARAAGGAPSARASGGGADRLITAEGLRRGRLTLDRRPPPLRLRPMPTLYTGHARAWRQTFMGPPLLLALASGLGLHLMGAGLLLSTALPMASLLLLGVGLGAVASRALVRKP
jgi:hypothetical protein